MTRKAVMEITYFPGCSLATSARESNDSLIGVCRSLGLELVDLDDWNCCGSSSAHSLDEDLTLGLCSRNLIRAPRGRPLMTMCPSCFKNLLSTQVRLKEDAQLRMSQEARWGGTLDPELRIVSFLEILRFLDRLHRMGAGEGLSPVHSLNGLRVAPYYGCMNMFPPVIRREGRPSRQLEDQLGILGAEAHAWPGRDQCCGTFLAATSPEITTPMVDRLMAQAVESGAECIVTACAMCQLNLEIRCTLDHTLPVLHYSEILALALGAADCRKGFHRHLQDPSETLKARGIPF